MQSNIPENSAFSAAPECDICKRQDETLRAVSLPYTFSVVVMTFRRAFAGTYCRRHRRLYLALASLITATVGWLGIPFGFLFTPLTLLQLASGGSSDPETNARLQGLLARRKLLSGDTPGAVRCLEESLRFQDSPEVRQRLSELYRTLPADLAADTSGSVRKVLGIVSVFAVAVLMGLVVGLFDGSVSYLLAPILNSTNFLLVDLISWLPFVLVLFFGILWLRSAVGAALTKGHIASRPLAVGLAASASVLAFYGIAEAETLLRNISRLFSTFAFGASDGVFAIRSLATSGAAYSFVNSYNTREPVGIILAIVCIAGFTLCLSTIIRSALEISRWQARLARVSNTSPLEAQPGSTWAWGTLAALLAASLAVILILYPGRLVNVEAAIKHFEQGWAPADENDLKGAMREFQLASSLWPDSAMAHTGMGKGLAELNDYDGALAELQAALEIGPDGPLPNLGMGMLRFARGEFAEAIRALNKTVAIEPGVPQAYVVLAMSHYELDEMQLASEELDRAIALSPNDPGVSSWIAGYFQWSGDLESAEKYVLKALEAEKSPAYYLQLADIYTLQRKEEEGRKALDEAEKLGGNQVQIALLRAFQAVQKRNLDEAESVILEALQAQPDDPDLLDELSLIHLRMGQLKKAVQEAEKSVQLNPYSAYSHTELAYAYQALGSLDKAIAEARKAAALLPKNDRAHFILGLSLIKKGMKEEGRKELETFLDLYHEREYVNADRQKALNLLGRSE